MPERSLSNTCNFSVRHITVSLHSGTLSTWAACLGAILKSKTTNKEYKNAKNVAVNILWKWHCLHYESWNKKAKYLVQPQLHHQETQILHCSVHVCKWSQRCHEEILVSRPILKYRICKQRGLTMPPCSIKGCPYLTLQNAKPSPCFPSLCPSLITRAVVST